MLRIVRELGQRVGPTSGVTLSGTRDHSGGHRAEGGLGLDKIRAHSRHRSIATLMLYVDEHDRTRTQATLADLVAGTVS